MRHSWSESLKLLLFFCDVRYLLCKCLEFIVKRWNYSSRCNIWVEPRRTRMSMQPKASENRRWLERWPLKVEKNSIWGYFLILICWSVQYCCRYSYLNIRTDVRMGQLPRTLPCPLSTIWSRVIPVYYQKWFHAIRWYYSSLSLHYSRCLMRISIEVNRAAAVNIVPVGLSVPCSSLKIAWYRYCGIHSKLVAFSSTLQFLNAIV